MITVWIICCALYFLPTTLGLWMLCHVLLFSFHYYSFTKWGSIQSFNDITNDDLLHIFQSTLESCDFSFLTFFLTLDCNLRSFHVIKMWMIFESKNRNKTNAWIPERISHIILGIKYILLLKVSQMFDL